MASDSLRQFLRAEVVLAVGPARASELDWSDCQLPTLKDVADLRLLFQGSPASINSLFGDRSVPTLFEESDGNWEEVAAQLALPRRAPVQVLSDLFSSSVLPSAADADTRRKH